MLANPPFGVEWKQQAGAIEKEHATLGYDGRFGIVFNGFPLFTGDVGSGESNIRQWIIENDWLEAIVALTQFDCRVSGAEAFEGAEIDRKTSNIPRPSAGIPNCTHNRCSDGQNRRTRAER